MAAGEAIIVANSAWNMPPVAECDPAVYTDIAADLSHFGVIAV